MRRFLMVCTLVLLTFVALPAAAQIEPRVPPSNDNVASATSIVVPNVLNTATMNESTIEVGEPAHQCTVGSPATGTGSIWYAIKLPGGDLTVDTAQSEFNTAVTLYFRPSGPTNLPTLQAAACADKGAGGSQQARLKYHAAAGDYLVQISAITPTIGGANDLRADFKFAPDVTPKGDNIVSPLAAIIGKVVKSNNVQYALREGFETAPSCDTNGVVSSVWFKLVVPFDGTLVASAEGSLISSTTGVDDDVTMTVYRGSNFLNFVEIDCSNDAAVDEPIISVDPGDTLWFRMTVSFPTNMFRAGTYKLSLRYSAATMLENSGFESDLAGWKVKSAANGDGITSTPGEPIGGLKAFKFIGGPSEATSLKQKANVPAALRFRNAILTPVFQTRALGSTQNVTWVVTLVPRDGSAPIKIKQSREFTVGTGSTSTNSIVPIESIASITLQITNKSASGSFVVDNVEIQLLQFSVLRQAGLLPSVLPLPPAPAGFRSPG